MNTIRFENKDAFVTALESRRAFWRKVDDKQAREHKTAEQAWLKENAFRMEFGKFDWRLNDLTGGGVD